jgi:hypothetical protein
MNYLLIVIFVTLLLITYFFHELGKTGINDHFTTPTNVQQARKFGCPIPLPDSAKNIQFGTAGAFKSYEYLVRFEASPEECRAFIKEQAVYLNANGDMTPIREAPQPEEAMFGKTPWFDIQNIKRGEMMTKGNEIWIDDDRGVFYYRRLQ